MSFNTMKVIDPFLVTWDCSVNHIIVFYLQEKAEKLKIPYFQVTLWLLHG